MFHEKVKLEEPGEIRTVYAEGTFVSRHIQSKHLRPWHPDRSEQTGNRTDTIQFKTSISLLEPLKRLVFGLFPEEACRDFLA
jgi:hypothetical protein